MIIGNNNGQTRIHSIRNRLLGLQQSPAYKTNLPFLKDMFAPTGISNFDNFPQMHSNFSNRGWDNKNDFNDI
jgi:hypothetical protein